MSSSRSLAENAAIAIRAEDVPQFRMAQLLFVLSTARELSLELDLEQVAVVEFLAANPFLVLPDRTRAANELRLRGFSRHSISYASPGQRYVSRRERVASDIAQLVSFGLSVVAARGGRRVIEVTTTGLSLAEEFSSVYADAYRASVREVLPVVTKLSSTKLQASLEDWLRIDPVLFDLFDAPTVEELVSTTAPFDTLHTLF